MLTAPGFELLASQSPGRAGGTWPGLLQISFFPWVPCGGGRVLEGLPASCSRPCPHLHVGERLLLSSTRALFRFPVSPGPFPAPAGAPCPVRWSWVRCCVLPSPSRCPGAQASSACSAQPEWLFLLQRWRGAPAMCPIFRHRGALRFAHCSHSGVGLGALLHSVSLARWSQPPARCLTRRLSSPVTAQSSLLPRPSWHGHNAVLSVVPLRALRGLC